MGILSLERLASTLARLVVWCTAIPLHESAHGLVSYWLGDPTAKEAGRITLNPLKHLDGTGMIALLIVGIGWAKPVPINVSYYKNRKLGMALSALAGPVSNLLLAFMMMIILKMVLMTIGAVGISREAGNFIITVLYMMCATNVMLSIFNMLPFPPFDGSRIYLIALPERWYFGIMKYERIMMAVVFLLLMTGILDPVLSFASNSVIDFLDLVTSSLGRLF